MNIHGTEEKPLSIAIALTLLGINIANGQMRTTLTSPFVPIPLDQQNSSSITSTHSSTVVGGGVVTARPNVTLIFDNSDSMNYGSYECHSVPNWN